MVQHDSLCFKYLTATFVTWRIKQISYQNIAKLLTHPHANILLYLCMQIFVQEGVIDGWLVFSDISTFVGYLMQNPIYIYIYIYMIRL